ncbi:RNA polymerase sigma factor [Nannocystaceae bacterium ST9]
MNVGQLYQQHAAMVLRRVLRFFPRDEAEEVVHEVFIKVLERIDGFRGNASPTTWLYRMTTNHCINRLRDQGRRRELWREQGLAWTRELAGDEQEAATFLREFWRELDHESVEIGIHYFIDGMTHAEIARVLGCSRRTVGNRIESMRARARAEAGLSIEASEKPEQLP